MHTVPQDQDAFWREIVDKHVLCAERVAQHRKAARKSPWVPLGRLLIREGYLTVRQVMGLVAMQANEPTIRIGDLAIREGLCTPEQIMHCLDVQSQSVPGPIEVVLTLEEAQQDAREPVTV